MLLCKYDLLLSCSVLGSLLRSNPCWRWWRHFCPLKFKTATLFQQKFCSSCRDRAKNWNCSSCRISMSLDFGSYNCAWAVAALDAFDRSRYCPAPAAEASGASTLVATASNVAEATLKDSRHCSRCWSWRSGIVKRCWSSCSNGGILDQ